MNNSYMYEDVLEFHKKFDLTIGSLNRSPSFNDALLRIDLIGEEHAELKNALERFCQVDIADACVDLIYVVIGTAITYGIDLRPIWDIVHKANMAKTGGGIRADGKVMKPKGWIPPEMAIQSELLRQHP